MYTSWRIHPKLQKSLRYIFQTFPDNIDRAMTSLRTIGDNFFVNKYRMIQYGKLLGELCDNHYIPVSRELISQPAQIVTRRKATLEEIASAMLIDRSTLEFDIHNYRFNPDSKRKDYFNNRRARLLLYSLFFDVSPLYLAGLTTVKHDYSGPDPAVMITEDFSACYNIIVAAFLKIELEHGKKAVKKHIEYLELFHILCAYIHEHEDDNEAIKSIFLNISRILQGFPRWVKFCRDPLFFSDNSVQTARDYRISNNHLHTTALKSLGVDFLQSCIEIGERSFHILLTLTIIIHSQSWEMLEGLNYVLLSEFFNNP